MATVVRPFVCQRRVPFPLDAVRHATHDAARQHRCVINKDHLGSLKVDDGHLFHK